MRPIYLSLAGLQSYREKQEIDFTQLSDAGVFGIFGPTGSGKSTILDAMTLALYGKVERATNGTQGIMNQSENVLSVVFAFELTHALDTKRFRVERQFKRAGDVSINNTVSRFIEVIAGESIVLADKSAEVNQRVQQVLGLSMQDFSRAVVLPQGKFAEFLSLKGSDRRQMLQRLFHLEPYGDQLNARLSQRFKETDVAIKQIVAEQQGLGDASAAVLEGAKHRLQQATEESDKQRALLQQIEGEWETSKQILAWQQEKQALEQKQSEHGRQNTYMAEREMALKKADNALRIRPLLEEWEHSSLHLKTQLEQREVIALQFELAKSQDEADSREYVKAKEDLAANDAPLQVEMVQLTQAVALQAEIQQGKAQCKKLQDEHNVISQRFLAGCEELAKERLTNETAVQLQEELKLQLKQVEVAADDRQKLQEASRDKQRIDLMNRQIQELAAELKAQSAPITAQNAADTAHSRQKKQQIQQMVQLLADCEQHSTSLQRIGELLTELLDSIPMAIETQKQKEKAVEKKRLAYQLANELKAANPCPVCGSSDHPAPALPLSDLPKEDSSELAYLEQLLTQTKEQGHKLKLLHYTLDGMVHKLQEPLIDADPLLTMPNTAMSEAAAGISIGSVSSPALPLLSVKTVELEESFRMMIQQINAMEAGLSQLEIHWKPLITQYNQGLQKQAESSAQLQALESVRQKLIHKHATAQQEQQQLISSWENAYRQFAHLTLTLETLNEQIDKLAHNDMAAEQLRKRLDKSVSFIENNQGKINTLQQQGAQLDKELGQAQTELKGLNQQIAEKQRQLTEQTGGESPEQRMAEIKSKLELIRRKERESRERAEQSQKQLQHLNHQFLLIEQACETAKQALSKADTLWHEALTKSDFSQAEEVREALLSDENVNRWEMEIKRHRELETELLVRVEQVIRLLQKRFISEEQGADMQLKFITARENDEAAVKQRAKSERDLEELESKHRRWCELADKLDSQQHSFAALGRLQSVLRGNAFVEYIAEEQLIQVSKAASERLGQLTRQRYALEVDSGGGFVIRDDANGGIKRPVGTLSGGETFLTSLALALALSAQIQLSGLYPLQFFFLDEGFGTLDPDLLETVVSALEKLHMDHLTVGVISHVPELKARLPRRLIVQPAEPTGCGSRVYLESL